MHLDIKTGKLLFKGKDITPPYIFTSEWKESFKSIFPESRISYSDYQRWAGIGICHDCLKVMDHYNLRLEFFYKYDWTIKELPKLVGLTIYFVEDFLKDEVFKDHKLLYHEKLKIVKSKFLKLLEEMTGEKLEITKKNVISFPPWGNALFFRQKKVYYELSIYWNYSELKN